VTATPPSAFLPDDVLAEVAFIGLKLVLQAGHKVISTSIPEIPSIASLGVIITVLTASIVLSLRRPMPPEPATDRSTPDSKETPWRSGIS